MCLRARIAIRVETVIGQEIRLMNRGTLQISSQYNNTNSPIHESIHNTQKSQTLGDVSAPQPATSPANHLTQEVKFRALLLHPRHRLQKQNKKPGTPHHKVKRLKSPATKPLQPPASDVGVSGDRGSTTRKRTEPQISHANISPTSRVQ